MDSPRTIGRYRLDSLLAAGAMGDVYRGHDPVIDRPVAIKLLRRDLVQARDADSWTQRFRREAQAAGGRFHPNIVTIFDFGEDDGMPFLAMEFVEGDNLDQLLKRSGRLPVERCVSIMKQVLSALAFIHGNGVIHRDIKPANIMVAANDQVKLADFSIAHVDLSELTIVGDVLGTPAYMAPEQLAGAPVDHSIDLFASGVMLFEMLTGTKPFRGRSITEMMSQMRTRGPEEIAIHAPEAPASLQQVLNTALAFDPDKRFPSAAEFSRSLADAAEIKAGSVSTVTHSEQTGVAPASPQAAGLAGQIPSETSLPNLSEASPPGSLEFTNPGPPNTEVLTEVEHELANFVGPLARIAVQRSAKTSGSIEELYLNLASHINNSADRAAFLAGGQRRVGADTARHAERGAEARSVAAARPLSPDALAPDILSRIEANLTQFVGPVARVIVRRQLSKSASLFDLYRDLAAYIPNERDRAEFLKRQTAA
jgi:eukaryotic-like serine/threonine-protein kinase